MMKVVAGILNVLVLLFSSTAAYGATLDATNFPLIENRLAERIHGLCSYAEETDEASLSDLEKLLAGQVKAEIKMEEDARNKWNRSEGQPERYMMRRAYCWP